MQVVRNILTAWPASSSACQVLVAVAVSALLAGCGGGGGAGADADAAVNAPTTVAMSTFSTTQMPQNFRVASAVPSTPIEAAAAALPASDGPTYLRIWILDPESGQPNVLFFGRWSPGQALARVHPPQAVESVLFEVYNAAGSSAGEWSVR